MLPGGGAAEADGAVRRLLRAGTAARSAGTARGGGAAWNGPGEGGGGPVGPAASAGPSRERRDGRPPPSLQPEVPAARLCGRVFFPVSGIK